SVVEAVPLRFSSRLADEVKSTRLRIEEMKAAAQRNDQTALLAHGEATDVFRRLPDAVLPCRRIKAVDRIALDVHPPQNLVARIPQRTLAKRSFGVDYAVDAGHVTHLKVAVRHC